jgi:hypothetical protein
MPYQDEQIAGEQRRHGFDPAAMRNAVLAQPPLTAKKPRAGVFVSGCGKRSTWKISSSTMIPAHRIARADASERMMQGECYAAAVIFSSTSAMRY